jgi:hypothetical protein
MIEIEESSVVEVLLHDRWHRVLRGTFKIDRVAFSSKEMGSVPYGESIANNAIWQEENEGARTAAVINFTAPLASLLAIKNQDKK